MMPPLYTMRLQRSRTQLVHRQQEYHCLSLQQDSQLEERCARTVRKNDAHKLIDNSQRFCQCPTVTCMDVIVSKMVFMQLLIRSCMKDLQASPADTCQQPHGPLAR